jgi:hypothetical protein
MPKNDLLYRIDQTNLGVDSFFQDNVFDPALTKTPDVPTGIAVTAVVDGILISIDMTIDTSHTSVANFEGYVVYARTAGDTTYPGVEVGRIPYGMNSWTWQPDYGGYTGWDVALTGIANTGHESAKSTWYRCVISTFHDDFSKYGGSTVSALEDLNWLSVETFENSTEWGTSKCTVANDTTAGHFVEGNQGLRVTTTSGPTAKTGKTVALNLSQEQRFADTDYITLTYYVTTPPNTQITIAFYMDGGNYATYIITNVSVGIHYLAVKRSDFVVVGDPWAGIVELDIYVDHGSGVAADVTFDDWRIVKADPAAATAFNDTGAVWDFNDGAWHIYPGDRLGEPDLTFTLGQIEGGAGGDYFFATPQNIKVTNGRASVAMYLKGTAGNMGLAFRCADSTLGSEDCLAVVASGISNKIYLVSWEAGGDPAVTNMVLNPSAEAAGNFGALGAATVTQSTTQARKGSYSFKSVNTAAANDGLTLTLSALTNAIHYVSYYVFDSTTAPTYDPFATAQVSLDNTNWHVPEVLSTGTGWARYGIQIPQAQANGSTTLRIRQSDATARTLYFDTVQVQAASAATAYADGSLGTGHSWAGTANASTSSRIAGTPVTVATATCTIAVNTLYWLGVDFRDPENERRVNVYLSTSQSNLFTAAALVLSETTPMEWPDGGGAGVITRDYNVRFGEFRAGSPQTADYAHRAGVAADVQGAKVYNDLAIGLSGAKVPAANAPTWATFNTDFNEYTFAVNDFFDLEATEFLHDWKEGTEVELHVHWVSNGQEVAAHGVKWQIKYCWANALDAGGTTAFTATATLSAETQIPAATPTLTHFYTSVGAFTPTGGKIGAYLKVKITRIASVTNTAPAANPFGLAVGVHYLCDTIGSRTRSTKT